MTITFFILLLASDYILALEKGGGGGGDVLHENLIITIPHKGCNW